VGGAEAGTSTESCCDWTLSWREPNRATSGTRVGTLDALFSTCGICNLSVTRCIGTPPRSTSTFLGGFFTLATALAGAGTMGLVLRDAENFLRFFLRRARPWARPCSSGSGGASRLGFESEDRTEPLSSEAGLLLWLCEWLRPLSLQLLQTES
jgi:hypothetical protein